jgi:hypothetical protein
MRVLDTTSVIYTVPGDLFVTLSTSDKGLFKYIYFVNEPELSGGTHPTCLEWYVLRLGEAFL